MNKSKTETSMYRNLKDLKNMSVSKVKNFDLSREVKEFIFPDDYLHSALQTGPENESVAVVIDGTNLYYMSKQIQSDLMSPDRRFGVDYDKLSKILHANFPNLRRKWYVTSQIFRKDIADDKDGFSNIRGLLDFLEFNRYDVVTRDITVIDNEQAHPPSLDVDITTCLFKAANIADHVVFIGSDRRYVTPLKTLRDMNKSVTVMSIKIPEKRGVADDLRKIDNFVNIATDWFTERLNTSNRDSGPRNFETKSE